MKPNNWIVIGEIVGTQGNKGELRVIAHTEFPERFSKMESVRLFFAHEEQPKVVYALEATRWHKGMLILKLEGIDSIDQAKSLGKMLIKINEAELVPLPPGRHYIYQLIGLEVKTTSNQNLGRIREVLQTGANDVYVIDPVPGITKQREILIPVIPQVVLEIEPEKGFVLVELLPGLLD